MKRTFANLSAVVLATVFGATTTFAQEEKEGKEKDKKNHEEVIIVRKGDKDSKVTIEFKGDNVIVNGTDLKDYKGDDVVVHRNKFDYRGFTTIPNVRSWNFNGADNFDGQMFMNQNRARLGVTTENHDDGAEVTTIVKGSAAEKAGLKKGDVITRVGDSKIEEPSDLTEAIQSKKPGEKVTVTYKRNNSQQTATAELDKWNGIFQGNAVGADGFHFEMPDIEAFSAPRLAPSQRGIYWYGGAPRLGLSVQDTDDGKGVKVIEVDDEGNAHKAGLREDDVITHVNDKEVNSTDDISKIVRENKDKVSVMVKLQRDGKTQNIEVKMPRKIKTADL